MDRFSGEGTSWRSGTGYSDVHLKAGPLGVHLSGLRDLHSAGFQGTMYLHFRSATIRLGYGYPVLFCCEPSSLSFVYRWTLQMC